MGWNKQSKVTPGCNSIVWDPLVETNIPASIYFKLALCNPQVTATTNKKTSRNMYADR
jgi:hypothetical protein